MSTTKVECASFQLEQNFAVVATSRQRHVSEALLQPQILPESLSKFDRFLWKTFQVSVFFHAMCHKFMLYLATKVSVRMLVWGNYMSNFDKIGFVFEDSLLYFGFSLLCRKHQQAHYGKFIFQAHLKVLGGTQNPIWTALSRFDSARSKSHWVGKAAEEGAHHRTRRKGGIESRMTPVLAPLGGTCS